MNLSRLICGLSCGIATAIHSKSLLPSSTAFILSFCFFASADLFLDLALVYLSPLNLNANFKPGILSNFVHLNIFTLFSKLFKHLWGYLLVFCISGCPDRSRLAMDHSACHRRSWSIIEWRYIFFDKPGYLCKKKHLTYYSFFEKRPINTSTMALMRYNILGRFFFLAKWISRNP